MPGFIIGPWRVRERWDQGSFGVVFKVARAGHPEAGDFALKVALHADDQRFAREVTLLQRISHPSIPRFEDRGWWKSAEGENFPYVVMEWVEGMPLYEWAQQQKPTSAQVLKLLAQLAGALAAAHAVGGVHRDVKGDNVLVTPGLRAVLLDWGAGMCEGAKGITDTVLPPGTSRYRAPEAVRWAWAHRKDGKSYEASPPDDVYALGVTAYRLCTGTYPPPAEEDSVPRRRLLPPRGLATVSVALDRLVLACLSENRRARPPTATLAVGLSTATGEKDAANPIVPTPPAADTDQTSHPGPPPQMEVPAWLTGALTGVVMGFLVVAVMELWRRPSSPDVRFRTSEYVRQPFVHEAPDAGVGEEVLASAEVLPHVGPFISSMGRPMPKQPYPNQRHPPCERGERAIYGACWVGPIDMEKPPCGEKMFDYEGRCYFASFDGPRQPTSNEPH